MPLERTGFAETIYSYDTNVLEERLFSEAIKLVNQFKKEAVLVAPNSPESEQREACGKNTRHFKRFAKKFFEEVCIKARCPGLCPGVQNPTDKK